MSLRKVVSRINESRKKQNRMPKIHSSIGVSDILEAIDRDENIGFCIACGRMHFGVEPDAESYACENCAENSVFGAEQIMLLMI